MIGSESEKLHKPDQRGRALNRGGDHKACINLFTTMTSSKFLQSLFPFLEADLLRFFLFLNLTHCKLISVLFRYSSLIFCISLLIWGSLTLEKSTLHFSK